MNICDLRNLNQGLAECDFEFGVPDYFIAAPVDAVIPLPHLKSPFGYLREMTLETDPMKRFYPIPRDMKRVTDNSTEATKGTLDKGYSKKLAEGRFVYLFEWPSAFCGDRNVYKFDGYNGGVFLINEKGILFGLRNEDGTLSPYISEIDVDGGAFSGSGGDVSTVKMTVDIGKKSEVVAHTMAIKLGANDRVNTLRGYRDLEILVISVATGIATVQLVTGGGENVNVYDQYSAKFGTAANWRVDGVAASAVTVDAPQKAFKITVGTGTHEINVAPVDVLKAADVLGFEGIPVTVTSE